MSQTALKPRSERTAQLRSVRRNQLRAEVGNKNMQREWHATQEALKAQRIAEQRKHKWRPDKPTSERKGLFARFIAWIRGLRK